MTRTTDDLINSVKTTATVPEAQSLITTARMLNFADEEIINDLLPMLDSLNQEFFVIMEEETIIAGTDAYNIPYRAVGRKLRDLKLSDGSTVRSLTKIALEDSHYYNFSASPMGYTFMGDKIIILPKPSVAGYTLQKFYLFRPSNLVSTSDAARVASIVGNVVTVNSVPMAFVNGMKVDFVKGISGYDTITYDQTISNISGLQVTVTNVPDSLAAGDWISQAGQSPVIQFPDECFSYLALRTAQRTLEAISDFEGAAALDPSLVRIKRNLQMMFEPRNEGASTKLIQRNGLLRATRQLRYYRGITS